MSFIKKETFVNCIFMVIDFLPFDKGQYVLYFIDTPTMSIQILKIRQSIFIFNSLAIAHLIYMQMKYGIYLSNSTYTYKIHTYITKTAYQYLY